MHIRNFRSRDDATLAAMAEGYDIDAPGAHALDPRTTVPVQVSDEGDIVAAFAARQRLPQLRGRCSPLRLHDVGKTGTRGQRGRALVGCHVKIQVWNQKSGHLIELP